MAKIVFPLATFPGEKPSEGAGRLINCYAEPLGEGGRNAASLHRSPGLRQFATSAESTFRGAMLDGSTLYVAYEDEVVRFDSAGVETAIDSLAGDDRVFWMKNNKRPTADILAVCAAGVFTVTTSAVTDLADADLPDINAGCFLDGYFFLTSADGRCFASGLNATTFAPNDFASTEAKSDTLLRPVPWAGRLYLCGAGSIEVWVNTANESGFPFTRDAVIQRGIAGQGAIAGFEDGFGRALAFVGDDNAVYLLEGYAPVPISGPDLNRLISEVSDKDTIEMSVYIAGGQHHIVVSSPTWTWDYNLSTKQWSERESYGAARWRAVGSVYAFGKWICGDTEDGRIGEITRAVHVEYTDPLIAEAWSLPVQNFPNRIGCARADFDFATGVGNLEGEDPIETDPGVEISYSDDGGYSFFNPRVRKLGRQGKPLTRVTVLRNGLSGAQGRIWKVRMSDPAHFGLMGGEMTAETRAA